MVDTTRVFTYPLFIKESYLDMFGHMNNATYLTVLEEARWDVVTKNGYGMNRIMETGVGPIILEIKLRFLKELRLREEVVIETQLVSYKDKLGTIMQKILRGDELCCTAEILFGLFSLKERKIILPTPEWLKAMGGS